MELDFIRWLRDRISDPASVLVGIGDDAAVLDTPGPIVVTTDMLMAGVDFTLTAADPESHLRRIGRKSLAVNLSDLAAMAAQPQAAFSSVALPKQGGRRVAENLFEGMLALAADFDVALAGGDTNSWDGPLVVNVMLIGQASDRGVLLRRGARSGDQLLVTGELGGSLLGKHFDFQPRVREALWLRQQYDLHAGIDISDGLALDASRLAEASGCGVELDLRQIPLSAAAHELAAAGSDGASALDHALGDGEDFELLLAVPPAEAERMLADQRLAVRITRIGQFVPQRGLFQRSDGGEPQPLRVRGYEHELT